VSSPHRAAFIARVGVGDCQWSLDSPGKAADKTARCRHAQSGAEGVGVATRSREARLAAFADMTRTQAFRDWAASEAERRAPGAAHRTILGTGTINIEREDA
jgi:hypothetical protein